MSTQQSTKPATLDRRTFLSGASAALLAGRTLRGGAPAKPPNIVFILADDMGYGDPSCYGQQKMKTPNIDRLAAEGMRLTDYYAGSTICSPSRCVLMTGLHTGHSRIRGNFALAGGSVGKKGDADVRRGNITAADTTVGQYLQRAGYHTGLVGKWHLDGYNPGATPLDHGFDEFTGWLIQTESTGGYFPAKRYHGKQLVDVVENQGGAHGHYETSMDTDEACSFLQRNSKRPFFLYLAYDSPHSPLVAPTQGAYAGKNWPDTCKTYAAMNQIMDDGIGRVMQTLKDLKVDEETIVFFASDNGPRSEPTKQLTEVANFFDSNGPLRGYKRDLYEGGIRVPGIARWPGHIKPNTVSDVPCYFADFLPTAMEVAGRPAPSLDGVSIMPLLSGARPAQDRFLYWETFEPHFQQAVRWGRWKTVRHQLAGPLELYDLDSDLGERNNLAAARPEIIAKVEAYLKTARTDSVEFPVSASES